MNADTVSQAEFGRMMGWKSRGAVSNHIARGNIAPPAITADGKIVVELARQQLRDGKDPTRPAPTLPGGTSLFDDDDDDEAPALPGGDRSLAKIKAAVATEQERKLRRENDEAAGLLVPKAEVEAAAYDVGRMLQQRVLQVPADVAERLAVENDPRRVETLLDEALRKALTIEA